MQKLRENNKRFLIVLKKNYLKNDAKWWCETVHVYLIWSHLSLHLITYFPQIFLFATVYFTNTNAERISHNGHGMREQVSERWNREKLSMANVKLSGFTYTLSS